MFEISNSVLTILLRASLVLICSFILLLPFIGYKIAIISSIFPAFDIIIMYYYTSSSTSNGVIIFLGGFVIDQMYSMPIGTNSSIFLLAYLLFKFFAQFFSPRYYLMSFIIFCIYCLLVIIFRCTCAFLKGLQLDNCYVILFQYLTTIFSYSLVHALLDLSLYLFQKNVKYKNLT